MRTSKGVRLTAEGEVLYSYVKRGYETILLGEKKFLEMQDLESGEICIGASDMTLQFFLLEYLERFHERYPKIKVTVTNATTPETLRHLQDGRIDFGRRQHADGAGEKSPCNAGCAGLRISLCRAGNFPICRAESVL